MICNKFDTCCSLFTGNGNLGNSADGVDRDQTLQNVLSDPDIHLPLLDIKL